MTERISPFSVIRIKSVRQKNMTQQAQASIIALVFGVVLLLVGIIGIYYQEPFWASGVVVAMNTKEDAYALGLPSGTTLAGAFLLSYVILASSLTANWSHLRRTAIFIVFSLGVLVGCGVAAWLAGQIVGKGLQMTRKPSISQAIVSSAESRITNKRSRTSRTIQPLGAVLLTCIPVITTLTP